MSSRLYKLQYNRLSLERETEILRKLAFYMRRAKNPVEAVVILKQKDALERKFITMERIARIRHDSDGLNKFYTDETKAWNEKLPKIIPADLEFSKALTELPFRKEVEEIVGTKVFLHEEWKQKIWSPDIVEDMIRENQLMESYRDLIAGAAPRYHGIRRTMSYIETLKDQTSNTERELAWIGEGEWYKSKEEEINEIFSALVDVRNRIARKTGYPDYVKYGYTREEHYGFGNKEMNKLRDAVLKYAVPVLTDFYRRQAELLGKRYPMTIADNALHFPDGNPKPGNNPAQTYDFFIKIMNSLGQRGVETLDPLIRFKLFHPYTARDKYFDRYWRYLPNSRKIYIFDNMTNTIKDTESMISSLGTAFAYAYQRRDNPFMADVEATPVVRRVQASGMDAVCFIFRFRIYGKDGAKAEYVWPARMLESLVYDMMTDEFEQIVYRHPQYTLQQRKNCWKKLHAKYMPWERMDKTIPFYGDGGSWMADAMIFKNPFRRMTEAIGETAGISMWCRSYIGMRPFFQHYEMVLNWRGEPDCRKMLDYALMNDPFDSYAFSKDCMFLDSYIRDTFTECLGLSCSLLMPKKEEPVDWENLSTEEKNKIIIQRQFF